MARTAETTRTRNETEPEPEHPAMYRVLLINDHYTTVDFVIWVLMEVFGKGAAEAYKIMLDVHHRGKGLAGIYTKDVAESKADRTMKLAREQGMPFRAEVEAE
jgi:ATP-dependent Clp protease adaptor protein ClpS